MQDPGLHEGNDPITIEIFLYSTIQFMVFEHYTTLTTTKLGISGHLRVPSSPSERGTPRTGIIHHGVAGATAQTIIYAFDVNRGQMQLETVLKQMNYVYGHRGIPKSLYLGLSPNYIFVIPS
ncbi:hypothetical protein HPG69_001418 [Diceros bicornis minor]|uniref:Uncharacterized protein n=1 Tax=Diceros bicornis minor TaxID=77932 RepID=A0A7J7FFT5_DICBM|nr:hypothetical protein HPG69_001418 [Diceros bicornis minor]